MDSLYQLTSLLERCTVRLSTPSASGTGFFVAPGLMLTCAHVVGSVQSNQTIVMVQWGDQNYRAKIVRLVPYLDLALLKLEDVLATHPCVLLHEAVSVGNQLYSYGYSQKYSDGDSASFVFEGVTGGPVKLLKFKEGEAVEGFSGAPLLNLRTGCVCGVMSITRGQNTLMGGRGVPTSVVLEQFEELATLQEEFHRKDRQWYDLLPESEVKKLSTDITETGALPRIWNIPYRRNPFFTGREKLLEQLLNNFTQLGEASIPQALNGLGGIGKTQITIEYAYRNRNEYNAVLWINATDRNTFINDFTNLATILNISEIDDRNQKVVVEAIKQWLTANNHWLLILDNIDNLELIEEYIPINHQGHLLLTTHVNATGKFVKNNEVWKMDTEEATLLLLHRAKLEMDITSDNLPEAEQIAVRKIVKEMDGLPLALDQVGAYIEETKCSFSQYLDLYLLQREKLLRRRGRYSNDYTRTVATTWSLSFQKIKKSNRTATSLLQLFAFLAPEAIPEAIITEGTKIASIFFAFTSFKPGKLEEAVEILLRYSLIRRNRADNTFSIHRLVQIILKESMNERIKRKWAKRTIRAVNMAYAIASLENEAEVQLYFPHLQESVQLIYRYSLVSLTASILLTQAGLDQMKLGFVAQGENLLKLALEISEQALKSHHFMKRLKPSYMVLGGCLNNLGTVYSNQGKYADAEVLIKRAIVVYEHIYGHDHFYTASSICNLATLYYRQEKYEEAEETLKEAIAIYEKIGPPTQRFLTTITNSFTSIPTLSPQEDEEETNLGYKQSLFISDKVWEYGHPGIRSSLNNLALLYYKQQRLEDAEELFKRALEISEQVQDQINIVKCLANLAMLRIDQHRYEEAEALMKRVLIIEEKALGPDHPAVAGSLCELALIYKKQGQYEPAVLSYHQALSIEEQFFGLNHPNTLDTLNELETLYEDQDAYEDAETLLRKALDHLEKTERSNRPQPHAIQDKYFLLLQKMQEKQKEKED